jgi:hypothetical protein
MQIAIEVITGVMICIPSFINIELLILWTLSIVWNSKYCFLVFDRLCDLAVRVLGYRSGGPGSIPGTTRKEK